MIAPQTRIMDLGGAYAFAGENAKASTIIHIPKKVKIRGKAVQRLRTALLMKNDSRKTPPRIMRNAPAFSGAHGGPFNADPRNLAAFACL